MERFRGAGSAHDARTFLIPDTCGMLRQTLSSRPPSAIYFLSIRSYATLIQVLACYCMTDRARLVTSNGTDYNVVISYLYGLEKTEIFTHPRRWLPHNPPYKSGCSRDVPPTAQGPVGTGGKGATGESNYASLHWLSQLNASRSFPASQMRVNVNTEVYVGSASLTRHCRRSYTDSVPA